MPTLMVPASVAPTAVDFPSTVKRSNEREGALYVTPLTQIELTDEELAYIRRSRKDLGDVLIPVVDPGETLAQHLAPRVLREPELQKAHAEADERRAEKVRLRAAEAEPPRVLTADERHQAQRAEEKATAKRLVEAGRRPVAAEPKPASEPEAVQAAPPQAPPETAPSPPQTEQPLQPVEEPLQSGFRAYDDAGSATKKKR